METHKIITNVEFDEDYNEYIMSDLEHSRRHCYLCRNMYEKLIGKEVTGKVTFILKKIKGRANNYFFPFSIKEDNLMVHYGTHWMYAKTLDLLEDVMDREMLQKWIGRSMFSIEVEYEIEN